MATAKRTYATWSDHDWNTRKRKRRPNGPIYEIGVPGLRGRFDELQSSSERQFAHRCIEAGWEVIRRGWPDFLLFRDGKLCAVEVKPNRDSVMTVEQWRIMIALSAQGIPCYRWSPDDGFVSITPQTPMPRPRAWKKPNAEYRT